MVHGVLHLPLPGVIAMDKHVIEAYERGWMYFSLLMILVFLVY
ncbi:MAG TPA: hypothetical protein ENJ76_03360, partial [Oceanithermus sp.]|nr:hypothetical protein [Oceanithermus sp.]